MALGLRIVFEWQPRSLRGWRWLGSRISVGYDLTRLFWLTISVYSVNWVMTVVNIDVWYEGSQIIGNVLAIRGALLAALWLEAMEQGKRYALPVVATAFATIPEVVTGTSRFSSGFFLMLVVLLARLRPWSRVAKERAEGVRILMLTIPICLVLVVLALAWQ